MSAAMQGESMTKSDEGLNWQVHHEKLSAAAEGAFAIARGLRRTVTETSTGCLAFTSAHQGFACMGSLARLHEAHSAHFEGHAAEADELTNRFTRTGTTYTGAEYTAWGAVGEARQAVESKREI